MMLQKPIIGAFDQIRVIKGRFSGKSEARTEVWMSGSQLGKERRKSARL